MERKKGGHIRCMANFEPEPDLRGSLCLSKVKWIDFGVAKNDA